MIVIYADVLASWTTMDSGTTEVLHSNWESSGNDVFAVGLNGTILHYDGSSWNNRLPLSASKNNKFGDAHIRDIWGISSIDFYAGGTGVYHNFSCIIPVLSSTQIA